MGLKTKLANNSAGILLYGMTPPKASATKDEIASLAQRTIDRLDGINIDGIVLYDIQDESERNKEERTFEFKHTLNPQSYYDEYFSQRFEAIIYHAVGKYSQDELKKLLASASQNLVFVGASSKDAQVKTKLTSAYSIFSKSSSNALLGGICIPERHIKNQEEHLKLAGKTATGCSFFITQAVYDLGAAKQLIDDYCALDIKKVPIIFTFAPCGSVKTLEFMRWLGISVPDFLAEKIQNSKDMLLESCELCFEMFKFLSVYGRLKGISVGANVESVSKKKLEIEAAVGLLRQISHYLKG